jgi:hypothetical protein
MAHYIQQQVAALAALDSAMITDSAGRCYADVA